MKSPVKLSQLAIVLATTGLLWGCQGDKAPQQGQLHNAPQVKVAQVIQQRITEWDEFTGRLQAPQTVELRPRVSGYIEEVMFIEGTLVQAGEVLFVIDQRPFVAEVARLTAEVADAQSQVRLTERELSRGKRLKAQNAIAQEQLDNRLASFQKAEAALKAKQAALSQAQLDLEFTQVKAPITGRVSRALITKGNYVTQGQSLLTSLVSTDKVYAYFDADEQTYLKYKQLAREGSRPSSRENQTPVFMGLMGEQGYPHTGHVDFLDNQVNLQTGTIRGRAVFQNQDEIFTPGLFTRIKVAGSASYNGVLIDDKAIGTDLSNKFVLVLDENNQVNYRPVELGKKHNQLRLVKKGLAPGETIVVSGLQRVRPGAQVTPNPVAMASEQALQTIAAQQQRVDALQEQVKIAEHKSNSDQRS